MKSLACFFIGWTGVEHDFEERVKQYDACQEMRHNQGSAPLHLWEYPKHPLE